MAIDIKDFSKILEAKLKEAKNELVKPSNMKFFGELLKEDIVKRTKLGYGVSETGANKEKLKPLSDSYKKQRQKKLGFWTRPDGIVVPIDSQTGSKAQRSAKKQYLKQSLPSLDSTTSASKSNLTRTGAMLENLAVISGISKFKIRFINSSQKKKAEYVSEKRPFMNASRLELKRLQKNISEFLSSIVKDKIKF